MLLCCKGEASPEGFRPAHRGLRAALAHAAPRVAEAPRKTPSARVWLRVDAERHALLKAAAMRLGVSTQTILATAAVRALRKPGPAPAAPRRVFAARAVEPPRRVKLAIRVTQEDRAPVKAAAAAVGATCQAWLLAALDAELAPATKGATAPSGPIAAGGADIVPLRRPERATDPSRAELERVQVPAAPPTFFAALDAFIAARVCRAGAEDAAPMS
ncbi:MAG: hypothetical protein ACM3O6_00630 [Acidobacteriota bacterium]